MDEIYKIIRERARALASVAPKPSFYKDFADTGKASLLFFEENPLIRNLYEFVSGEIDNDFGHGLGHVVKVAVDAGTLMLIEGGKAGLSDEHIKRQLLIVQVAGLLHDIKRKMKNHAEEGAVYSETVLKDYALTLVEIEDICQAIRNHEAFRTVRGLFTPEGILVSNCLYDADKFRWGPDNFTHTVWEMVSFAKIPLKDFVSRYPGGINALSRIKSTFRTQTGKQYGPQFIDIGVNIGNQLYNVIKNEFADECFSEQTDTSSK